ncbi:MAG: 50S ribosomal protein L18 [Elusimicrobia bacterium]|nr:50S ribosomal protein L18 [Elusimicrobiota bacterium]MDE2236411.1 50S ribosomal protein L18 [Elusimicrobiota bacterium]MDE2425326.1 50S ribosomal protein L18 [Elusimicrobiota bacterium]
MKDKWTRYEYRTRRTRDGLREATINNGRPRLTVHRSLKYIYAQVVDDAKGKTLAFASSLEKEVGGGGGKSAKNVAAAKKVGAAIAKKALAAGVKQVAFDRGGRIYHGRVKALAEAAREGGLEF